VRSKDDEALIRAIARLEATLKQSKDKGDTYIDARPQFKEQTNPHSFSEELAFRLKAAM